MCHCPSCERNLIIEAFLSAKYFPITMHHILSNAIVGKERNISKAIVCINTKCTRKNILCLMYKMAQKMEDMTFLYDEMRVPKKYYKEKLAVAVEEMIQSGVEMNLIATYYRTLEELKKQNGK